MGILLQNGNVLNHQGDAICLDILIEGNRIAKKGISLSTVGHRVIDCQDQWIFPGLIDIHVHLREPGFEGKETIATGTAAAVKGGFTTVACMPNTNPVLDHPEQIRYIHDAQAKAGYAKVLPIAAITYDQAGKELTDFAALKEAGIVGVSDDGFGVQSSYMMKQAMRGAQQLGLPVIAHCEDDTFIGGSVHEGVFAQKHGLKGIPSESESIHVGRDIILAETTGCHYHICHISTKESVQLVREAKQRGVAITAEVSPHHLLLSEDDIPGLDPNYKMNPPLRSAEDRQALIEGLLDGTIDIIATDHAPHTPREKEQNMEKAPFGIVGSETAFPLLYTYMVQGGLLTLLELIEKMTTIPADLFGLPSGRLYEGAIADITIVDAHSEKEIDSDYFVSKGKNTPFNGWRCAGWPVMTIVEGNIVWSEKDGFYK